MLPLEALKLEPRVVDEPIEALAAVSLAIEHDHDGRDHEPGECEPGERHGFGHGAIVLSRTAGLPFIITCMMCKSHSTLMASAPDE